MIQLFNSKCLSILYYGIDVCPLTNTQSKSLQFVISSCYSKVFVIKSNDDIRYSQDVFGCLPVADIVERRTAIFLKKYKVANDNNIVCQACIRHWKPIYYCNWLVEILFFLFSFFKYCLLSTTCGKIKMYRPIPIPVDYKHVEQEVSGDIAEWVLVSTV